MYIEQLSLVNFKNFTEASLDFSPSLNCFIGNNGAGKTNLMDAIHYLSFTKSFLNPVDGQNIRHGEEFFMVQGKYKRFDSEEDIYCGLKKGTKKVFKRNKKTYQKISEHIGLLPLIVITPSDTSLITGGSEERRKFLDSVISQYNPVYLNHLIRYNRALQQRNNLLKQFGQLQSFNADSLDVWDEQLLHYGLSIHQTRSEYIEKLLPVFQHYYDLISGGKEMVGLVYQSQLNECSFSNLLAEARGRDRILQYTSCGIHKDDIDFNLGEYSMRRLGSQGQRKTYLIALKLAQFDSIKNTSGLTPILLLDDIFDKLDKNRVEQIVKLVSGEHFGQIFITDTNREHLDLMLENIPTRYQIFRIHEGSIAD